MLGVDPLNRPLQPKYIDRIPRIQRKGVEVPALNDFIFSDGFHLETNMLKTKQLTIPFVMTGVQATRQYVMSLITYEDLYDYVQIINDIIENEKELEICNLENTKSQNYERIYVSEDYLKSNNIDQDLLNDLINLKQIYKKFDEDKVSYNVFCVIKDYIISCISTKKIISKNGKANQYFIPKCISMTSEIPIFEEMNKILLYIFLEAIKSETKYLLDTYFAYLTHFAPLPIMGTRIEYTCLHENRITIESSNINELPNINSKFYCDFFYNKYMLFDDFISTLYWFMAQVGSVLFLSDNLHKILACTEVLRTVIYPFEYDDTYIIGLPKRDANYLEAPFPCLIGMVARNKSEVSQIANICADKTLIVSLDIDKLYVKYNNEVVSLIEFMNMQDGEEDFSRKKMPKQSKIDHLKKSISDIVKMEKYDEDDPKSITYIAGLIREEFLNYFVYLFHDYKENIVKDFDNIDVEGNVRKLFKEENFTCKDKKESDFFKEFFDTRSWISFLEMKLYPDSIQKAITIKTFDEKIAKYQQKKSKMKILKRLFTKKKNESSWLNKIKERQEYKYIFKGNELVNNPNGILCTYSKESTDREKILKVDYDCEAIFNEYSDKMKYPFKSCLKFGLDEYFTYKVIPEFCAKLIPSKENMMKECFEPLNFASENPSLKDLHIHNPKDEHIPIYKLNGINKKGDIYIVWIIMWCLTFKYVTGYEREFRVEQIVCVIDSFRKEVPGFKKWINIFEEVLKVIRKNGTVEMIVNVMKLMHYFDVKLTPTVYKVFFDCISSEARKNTSNNQIEDTKLTKMYESLLPNKDKNEQKLFFKKLK